MNYIDLNVWIESRELVKLVYELKASFPKEEIYGLTSQIRRCAVSVPSNIAEGCGRRTSKETIHFLYISRGSLYELEAQVYISNDMDYVSKNKTEIMLNKITICKKLLNGFINYYRTK
jgi:four helix bundle protein